MQYAYHVFHTNRYFSIAVKSTVKTNDIRRITVVKDLQLSDDLIPNCWLDFQMNQLKTSTKNGSMEFVDCF